MDRSRSSAAIPVKTRTLEEFTLVKAADAIRREENGDTKGEGGRKGEDRRVKSGQFAKFFDFKLTLSTTAHPTNLSPFSIQIDFTNFSYPLFPKGINDYSRKDKRQKLRNQIINVNVFLFLLSKERQKFIHIYIYIFFTLIRVLYKREKKK